MIRPLIVLSALALPVGIHVMAAEAATEAPPQEITMAVGNLATFGIVTEPVAAMVVAEPILAPGWVTYDPQAEAQVGVQAQGRILRITSTVGAMVQAGQVLAEVLSPAFVEAQNTWLIRRAALATAELAIDQAKSSVARGQQSGEGISKAELQRRQYDLQVAQQGQITAKAELAAALNSLRLMAGESLDLDALASTGVAVQTLTLRAPVSGQVVDLPAIIGQQVSAEGGPVATIADPQRLWVVVQIPESAIAQVQVGAAVELTGFSGSRLTGGHISHMTPEIDPHTRTGRLRVTVEATADLRPGMYVQAAIVPRQAGAMTPVLAVPESALVSLNKRSVVFVEERHGDTVIFRPRPVAVGPVQGGHAPLESGVKAGEVVVVQGAFLLKADLGKGSVEEE